MTGEGTTMSNTFRAPKDEQAERLEAVTPCSENAFKVPTTTGVSSNSFLVASANGNGSKFPRLQIVKEVMPVVPMGANPQDYVGQHHQASPKI